MYIYISIYNTYTFSLSLQAVKLAKYPTLYARAALRVCTVASKAVFKLCAGLLIVYYM